MKCIVCVKQVPDTANVEVDPVTGVLKRDGTQSKLNPYDLYAMESALGLKEQLGGVPWMSSPWGRDRPGRR